MDGEQGPIDPIPMDDYTRRHIMLVTKERDEALAKVQRLEASGIRVYRAAIRLQKRVLELAREAHDLREEIERQKRELQHKGKQLMDADNAAYPRPGEVPTLPQTIFYMERGRQCDD